MLKKVSAGKKMHDPEILGSILKELGRPIPKAVYHWVAGQLP